MQLHACLLLFIITTDKTLACGGNISLDEEPAGHVSLSLPGAFTDTKHQADQTPSPSLCTWALGIPRGRAVLLKPGWLEGGWSVSVRCALGLEVLESGSTARLSHCDGNKATVTWTGAGRSSRELQLFYYVQEDERNSSENHTSFTAAPVGQEVARGTEKDVWRVFEGLERSSGSSPSSQDPLSPTSPLQGFTVAGRADRETLPLPEEELNNGADTSGAEGKMSAGERTQPYFQHGTDAAFHKSHAEIKWSNTHLPTQTMATHAAASSSNAVSTQTAELSGPTGAHLSYSDPPLTTEISHWTTWESGTLPTPHGGAVSGAPGGELTLSWRSQQSTASDLMSAVTSDPLKSPTELQPEESSSARADTRPTAATSIEHSLTTHMTAEAASLHPNTSVSPRVTSQTAAFESSDTPGNTETLHVSSSSSQTSSEGFESSPPPDTSSPFTQTIKDETTRHSADATSSTTVTEVDDWTRSFTSSFLSFSPRTLEVVVHSTAENDTPPSTDSTNSPTPPPPSESTPPSTPPPSFPGSHFTHSPPPLPLTSTEAATLLTDHETTPTIEWTSSSRPPSTSVSVTQKQLQNHITTAHTPLLPLTTAETHYGHREAEGVEEDHESFERFHSSATTQTPPWTSSQRPLTPSDLTSTTAETPKFYIVPDQPAAIRVESVELLLQILVNKSRSTFAAGLEEEASAWVEPFLQKAPGFSRLLGVWSSGHAVQILVEFKTRGALQWLSLTGPTSLLERTGLTQAVCDGRSFRSSKITNITLGGVQGDVCDWLLQCPSGYRCVFQPDASNYSCSSVCHFDYCHHHGICTHHPAQHPVCRCLVGEDFWYMGQRCDMRMTRARLVGACLAILLVMATVIGVLALVAVRRYRAVLIQAKVDQTRSSYRRFNHFDELSGRFWLRSWAGSADSLDNPAFTRSDELLHLRALDRPCCYHDDTLSLASTCPSHGTRINTIYPHSSQYGWRGSEVSVGDGVLDSGKASDLSVCSWPVEPIHWTPFPLLQQLASHRTPTVRASRPRSYCEGMELVDLGKSWTA